MKNYLIVPVIYLSVMNFCTISLCIFERNQRLNEMDMVAKTMSNIIDMQEIQQDTIMKMVNMFDIAHETSTNNIPSVAGKPIYVDSKESENLIKKYYEQTNQTSGTTVKNKQYIKGNDKTSSLITHSNRVTTTINGVKYIQRDDETGEEFMRRIDNDENFEIIKSALIKCGAIKN